ncbi:MAG: 16S rRNA processing protein RimM [Hyphomicrobiaceae bacterium]|nr:16S rRNA processing protein RimM [Hyphomicrobiaceae bacterium]
MSSFKNDLVLLGFISAAHGIHGEVIIQSYTDKPMNIGEYGVLSSEDGRSSFELSKLRTIKKGIIACITGITDRNKAEFIKGTKLYVRREKLPILEAGEIYHVDLIGMKVVYNDCTELGVVISVHNFGASDLLEIQLNCKQKTEFVPFTSDFIVNLSVESGIIVVAIPQFTAVDRYN